MKRRYPPGYNRNNFPGFTPGRCIAAFFCLACLPVLMHDGCYEETAPPCCCKPSCWASCCAWYGCCCWVPEVKDFY